MNSRHYCLWRVEEWARGFRTPPIGSNQSKQLTEPSRSGLRSIGAAALIEGYFLSPLSRFKGPSVLKAGLPHRLGELGLFESMRGSRYKEEKIIV